MAEKDHTSFYTNILTAAYRIRYNPVRVLSCMLAISILFLFPSCQREISCEWCMNENKPPVARTGPDVIINLPLDSVLLDGSNSSDPDGSISNYLWSKISGPASSIIRTPGSPQTIIAVLTQGAYSFVLKVTDDKGLSDIDTVQVLVNDPALPNRPPVADAGPDIQIVLPTNAAYLNGSNSSDPDNNIVSYLWTKISGPQAYTISNANAAQTHAANLEEGVYWFELRVSDAGGLSDVDTVVVNVISPIISCNVSTRPQVIAQLIHFANLSVPRADVAAEAAGHKIVFAGGYSSSGESAVVDIFDISTQSWSGSSLSKGRTSIAAASSNSKIIFAGGGYYYSDYFSNIDIYDVVTNNWSRTQLSIPKTLVSAVAMGDTVMVAGGSEISSDFFPGNITDMVEIFSLSANSWTSGILSEARTAICGLAINNKIYFAGGATEYAPSSRIDIFDQASNSWSTSSLSFLKGGLSGIVDQHKIYWVAGEDCRVEIRDINTGISTTASLSQKSTYRPVIVRKNGKLVFIFPGSNRFDIYDPVLYQWSVGILPEVIRPGATVIEYNNVVYIAGGQIGCIPIPMGCRPVYTNNVYKLEF